MGCGKGATDGQPTAADVGGDATGCGVAATGDASSVATPKRSPNRRHPDVGTATMAL